jgi:hypothetical protein
VIPFFKNHQTTPPYDLVKKIEDDLFYEIVRGSRLMIFVCQNPNLLGPDAVNLARKSDKNTFSPLAKNASKRPFYGLFGLKTALAALGMAVRIRFLK